MAKLPIQIDKVELETCIQQLETTNAYTSRGQLWEAVALTEWAKTRVPRPLSAQVAMIKAKEFGIPIKTQRGEKGQGLIGTKIRTPRGRKVSLIILEGIQATIPSTKKGQYEKTLKKLGNGSLVAAVKMKCLECSNFEKKEIAACPVSRCALYPFRPYQP